MSRYYITTPIYYVNDKPHIGHSYTTILADVLARYHRLLGDDTYFLTGADEHGQKVEQAARKRGIDPQGHADETVVPFQELWKKLEITHNDFIRTSEERHKQIVQEILQDLYDRGEIYQSAYDGWYSVTDERFYTEKELVDGKSPDSGQPVERITESNYFFRMSAYQDWLVSYIEAHPEFIQPDFRRNETLGFLRKPLQDLCISRPKKRLSWGIELPFDSDYVCYVWFDALVNYISAIGYRRDEAAFNRRWPAECQVIGKDILTTHTVYWPTMLHAMGLPQPRMIFAHGWWLIGETKMSKSLGNVVNPMDLIDRFGVDPFRYFLIASMVLGQDASFTEDLFVSRYNTELANDLGNLHSRLLSMMGRYCDGLLPAPEPSALEGMPERELWDTATSAAHALETSVRNMSLDQGIAQVLTLVRSTNRYLELKQPWTQAKQADRAPLRTTLYTAAEALRVAAGLLYPIMPERMGNLRAAYGLSPREPAFDRLREWGVLPAGSPVGKAGSLFPKVEAAPAEPVPAPARPAPSPESAEAKAEAAKYIAYDDFRRVELRTARVLVAERVAGTDKLMRLEVMVGDERRQIVAGIAGHYAPDELLGKTVVVVANLQPATIRGVTSHGMLLAAGKGETLRLVTIDGELSSGAPVR